MIDHEVIIHCDLSRNWLTSASNNLEDFFYNLYFAQLISHSSHPNLKDSSKSNLIGLKLTDRPEKYSAYGVFDLGVSGCCLIVCIIMQSKFTHCSEGTFNDQAFLHDLKIPDP